MASGPDETATYPEPSTSTAVPSQDSDSDDDDCGKVEDAVTRKEVFEHVHKTNFYLMQTGAQDAAMKAFYHFKDILDKHMHDMFAYSNKNNSFLF